GGPITPRSVAIQAWVRRHACVSFANPEQIGLAAEVCQSFMLDNGAYPLFTAGDGDIDVPAYYDFVGAWALHPGFDWCLIPDKIDGDATQNDALIETWQLPRHMSVPVFHMHEPLERMAALVRDWPRVAIGSSGDYWEIGCAKWWGRMHEVMMVSCDEQGRPLCKLHGLRMLDPTIFSHLPLSSADSTNVARNVGLDVRWTGPYQPKSKETRALILIDRIEAHASASIYTGSAGTQMNWELIG
ncbi:MAG: hypothetical protein EBR82_82895, partial [Caulobacteraceae bacterium]|nr:hypothetical protein [Caulobacteraceae bacterium]